VRGAGEGGLTGAGAAVASAVSAALRLPAMTALPISPVQVLAGLHAGSHSRAEAEVKPADRQSHGIASVDDRRAPL
jgi:hypothetical protein